MPSQLVCLVLPLVLQVELSDELEGGASETSYNVVKLVLWRRDLLSGTLELDEALRVRKASTMIGLIMGYPSTAILRQPLAKRVLQTASCQHPALGCCAATRHTGKCKAGGISHATWSCNSAPLLISAL